MTKENLGVSIPPSPIAFQEDKGITFWAHFAKTSFYNLLYKTEIELTYTACMLADV